MKRQLILVGLVMALAGAALAQMSGLMMVSGKCTDEQGKPYTNGFVRIVNTDTGRKYEMKLNSKGEYLQSGVPLGKYDATLVVDGKDVFKLSGVEPGKTGDMVINFDMAKERAMAASGGGQPGAGQPGAGKPVTPPPLSAEEQKQNQQIESENAKIRDVNKLMQQADASAAATPPNYDQSIALMTQASQIGPNFPLVWVKLADYQTKAQKWDEVVASLENAIKTSLAQPPDKQNKAQIAGLQNNLGSAYLHTRKMPEAAQQFEAAAQTNPAGAAMFYTNESIALQNMGKVDESAAAANKAIAADPNAADAYYWRGVALLSKGVTDTKTGKTTYPPDTAPSLQKYMELAPAGKHAAEAKALLEGMGEQVQTQYKSTTGKKPK
jgi:Tfp pilus assembly protein PilF